MKLRLSLIMILVSAGGCASKAIRPVEDPAAILAMACRAGQRTTETRGSVWLKARSKEAEGQFPAQVKASADRLELEVTNLLGGTEAWIQVQGHQYEIRVPSKKGARKTPSKVETGSHSWGGIPLRWASDLFLGRTPCPNAAQLNGAKIQLEENGQLSVKTLASLNSDAETFVFQFRSWAGARWVEALQWERTGTFPLTVQFTFDQPDDHSASPLKWEAHSEQGEVKVRWKDRQVQESPLSQQP